MSIENYWQFTSPRDRNFSKDVDDIITATEHLSSELSKVMPPNAPGGGFQTHKFAFMGYVAQLLMGCHVDTSIEKIDLYVAETQYKRRIRDVIGDEKNGIFTCEYT